MSFFWPIAQAKRDDSVTSHDAGERTAGVRQPGEITRTPDLGPSQQPSMVQNDSEREDTAHDRAVRELLGLGLETSSPSNSNNAGGTSGLPNDRAGAGAGAGAGATVNALNSGSAAFPPGPEKIYDPATGSLAGFIRQNQNGNGTGDVGGVQSVQDALSQQQQKNGNTTASEAQQQQQQSNKNASLSEDMWNQLSKIRVLQSEIARMHLALDKSGIIEGVKSRQGTINTRPGSIRTNTNDTLGAPISRSGTGAGVGVDNGADAANKSELPTVPEDEFAKRKASIGAIMTKLDALSVAVTEFHTLPTPPLDFPSPSSATSSRANSLQPFLDRDNKNNVRRKIFSEPSLMSNVSNVTSTTRPPSVDTKDHVKPPPSSTLNTATPIPAVTRTGTGAGRVDGAGSGLGVGATTPLPSASSSLPVAGAQRRLPSPLTINAYSRTPNVELSQSSSASTPPSAQPQVQSHSQNQTPSYRQGQRLETLYEPQGEPPKSSEATPPVPATPVVTVERVIDGIPTGDFRVTSRHESPLGTPTSLVHRLPLSEEGPANGAGTAGGGNDNRLDTGLGNHQR